MFLAKIVLSAFICTTLTNYIFVAGENEDGELGEQPKEKTEPPPLDNYTFVALIDIVFSDGKKKTCTGTIIHDNVVITAAHCFVDHNPYVAAELTASFVVIGTKKMYDTGYENYLPIERVVTHPKYKGWTADLALVYTFAGMTSDKPGNIMPLMGEGALTPVDSNVTILSWGYCKDEIQPEQTRPPNNHEKKKRKCDSSEENHESCETGSTTYGPLRAGYSSDNQEGSTEQETVTQQRDKSDSDQNVLIGRMNAYKSPANTQGSEEDASKIMRLSANRPHDFGMAMRREGPTTRASRYLTSESKPKIRAKKASTQNPRASSYPTLKHRYIKASRNSSFIDDPKLVKFMNENTARRKGPGETEQQKSVSKEGDVKAKSKDKKDKDGKEQNGKEENAVQKYYKNWRRTLGSKENKLTIEIFGFVNVQTCKKLVDKAMPALYAINTNEVVCYAAEEHYISSDDSGAPAIRQGHLVAVTLGGVECEGDHVAIGIKMTCFCSWIAENLPSGGEDMKCCKDCCGEKKEEPKYYRQRHVNHYLRNINADQD